jgi:ribosomal protein S14
MSKKIKKVYKPHLKIAPKLTVNRKWTVWRNIETQNRESAVINETKKIVLHYLQKNNLIARKFSNLDTKKILPYYHASVQVKLEAQNKRASYAKLKNYCHYVGRSRSVNRKMFMARHVFRKFARFGMLPGFVKERC